MSSFSKSIPITKKLETPYLDEYNIAKLNLLTNKLNDLYIKTKKINKKTKNLDEE